MLHAHNTQAFTQSLREKIAELTKEALSLHVSDATTHDLKVRIQALKDVLDFAQGETDKL